jgi:lipopolysaccharide/colanic/teichoic acid biosynthesis glycosyltransferase
MMSKKKLDLFIGLCQATMNLGVLIGTYAVVFLVRQWLAIPYAIANRVAVQTVLPYIVIVYAILWVAFRLPAFFETPAYEGVLSQVFVQVIIAVLSLAASFFVRAFAFPRGLVLWGFCLQTVLLLTLNYGWHRVYLRLRPIALTICVGVDTAAASALAASLGQATGYRTVTATTTDVTEKWVCSVSEGASLLLDAGVPVLERDRIMRLATTNGIAVQLVATVGETLLQNASMKVEADHLILSVEPHSHSPVDLALKRMLDLAVSVFALLLFSPILLAASIAIVSEDGRPVFYLQRRSGLHGKVFRIIKFRTMCHDAERLTGACLSQGELDRRITRIGRLLRKSGLDEVPQFVNVLRGAMSVVGPRPERPELAEKILEEVPDWNLRLLVRPGITGVAQVLGRYSTLPEDKLTMDLAYIRSRSLFISDLTIILHTLKMFFMPERRN